MFGKSIFLMDYLPVSVESGGNTEVYHPCNVNVMTPPDITARCPYDSFTSVTPSQLTLMDHSEELHPEGPAHLKTTSQALLQATEVPAPTIPVALADSTLLAITCKVSGHKTWVPKFNPAIPN
ncbi:hypothetical protein L6452_01969 [Arctium lappa]|uniref:Uncharacterized protein n=1 Tax=Arctium lappa TaxID=4217 RepID=A0ACB9FI91_ARCLA|nr:hypothetical protein L6452_01969 [Arctium lappa]